MGGDALTHPTARSAESVRVAIDEMIDSYRPTLPGHVWDRIGPFIRPIVHEARPSTIPKARQMLGYSARFVAWATGVKGFPMHRDLFDVDLVKHFCAELAPNRAGISMKWTRRVLTDLAEQMHGQNGIIGTSDARDVKVTTPYSTREIASLLSWCRSLPGPQRRRKALVILCLGIGCGLTPAEMATLHVDDVIDHGPDTGIELTVHGRTTARATWCLIEWEDDLRSLLTARDRTGNPTLYETGSAALTQNTIWAFLRRARRPGETAVSTLRLRTTWLVHHLTQGTPLNVLQPASGYATHTPLSAFLSFVPTPELDAARRSLREGLNH